MATILERTIQTPPDPETGCRPTAPDYQQCRQAYFINQQNQILQQQKDVGVSAENSQLKSELETLKSEVQALRTEQEVQVNQTPVHPQESSNVFLYVPILILIITLTAIITRYLTTKHYGHTKN